MAGQSIRIPRSTTPKTRYLPSLQETGTRRPPQTGSDRCFTRPRRDTPRCPPAMYWLGRELSRTESTSCQSPVEIVAANPVLAVHDLQASAEWYRQVLGCARPFGMSAAVDTGHVRLVVAFAGRRGQVVQ